MIKKVKKTKTFVHVVQTI